MFGAHQTDVNAKSALPAVMQTKVDNISNYFQNLISDEIFQDFCVFLQ